MSKNVKFGKVDTKGKNSKASKQGYYEEEYVSFKELKKEKEHKHYRNFENALRSKNISALMEYEDD